MTMKRFVVSSSLPKFYRDQGFKAEIIDRKHPSDGGPVAVEWFKSREEAESRLTDKQFSA